MTWHKVKLDKADTTFSKFIRGRDKRCVRCKSDKNLQCSHFWGRGKERTRYDEENCDCLCAGCHRRWETEKEMRNGSMGEYAWFKFEQLGKERYDALKVRAHTYQKKDRKMSLIKSKALLNSL